jgi:hypothetical protein
MAEGCKTLSEAFGGNLQTQFPSAEVYANRLIPLKATRLSPEPPSAGETKETQNFDLTISDNDEDDFEESAGYGALEWKS